MKIITECRSKHRHDGITSLKTCQYIEKMVLIVPHQLQLVSDDEIAEVAGRQETDSQGLEQYVSVVNQMLTSLW